jgi:hypothetical protein
MRISRITPIITTLAIIAILTVPFASFAPVRTYAASEYYPSGVTYCRAHANCPDVFDYSAGYIGHDEPSLLFYSNQAGSGNHYTTLLRLPEDPPKLPNQAGTGGTFNFQLHPAFWFGMALCDDQSAPNPGGSSVGPNILCAKNSDSNIYDSANCNSSGLNCNSTTYIGKHPGTAFMEMQFYPPGWVAWPPGNSCDPVKWCAALNIDSLSENQNTGLGGCFGSIVEYVNFAFITLSGVPHPDPALGGAPAPANPVQSDTATFTPDPVNDLFMNSGDVIELAMFDTPAGFKVQINDLTSHQSGSMTASIANTFGAITFDPSGATCNNLPYAFHPMYSTSSEHTRVPWAAHSYSVAFSDEIGHWEYCSAAAFSGGPCAGTQVHDTDLTTSGISDDGTCFNPADSTRVQVGGCFAFTGANGGDSDFDGPEYLNNWPGTLTNVHTDQQLHAAPIRFTSPLFTSSSNGQLTNYNRIAFETDLPRVEGDTLPRCQRSVLHTTSPNPGQDCVNPPANSVFYPIYTTGPGGFADMGQCVWQLGGAFIPGSTNTFGGFPATEYGTTPLGLNYPRNPPGTLQIIYEDFRTIWPINSCQADASLVP